LGPTATGKTGLALALADAFPVDIVSVDSALVYRGMDIGTAKPDPGILARYPHALVDILDPAAGYSAGAFVTDARSAMQAAWDKGRLPLLVGGTMLYFRALREGLARLPDADPDYRAALDREAAVSGWAALHGRLAEVDPAAAAAIQPGDRQRVQRALEVWHLAGRPISEIQAEAGQGVVADYLCLALLPPARPWLHERIERRFDEMLSLGFLNEVAGLHARPDLAADLPAMRAVGYRQLWAHLDGKLSLEDARYRGIVATRQLAKRQLTWLRSERGLRELRADEPGLRRHAKDEVERWLESRVR
jgi:tRNA dimethylallyltransferase